MQEKLSVKMNSFVYQVSEIECKINLNLNGFEFSSKKLILQLRVKEEIHNIIRIID